jgi:hypothetical protein
MSCPAFYCNQILFCLCKTSHAVFMMRGMHAAARSDASPPGAGTHNPFFIIVLK